MTSTPRDQPATSFLKLRVWAVTILGILFFAGFLMNGVHGLTAKTDTFWFYLIGQNLNTPSLVEAAERSVEAAMKRAPIAPDLKEDFVARENVETNYLLSSAIAFIAAKLTSHNERERYVDTLSRAIVATHFAAFALIAIFTTIMILLCHPTTITGFVLALTVIALLNTLSAPDPSGNLLLLKGPYALANFFVLLVDPGEALGPLTIWPRGSIALLMMLIAALRWEGRYAAGYGVFIVAMLVQQNLAILSLLFLLTVDFLLRPRALLQRGVWLTLASVVAISILNWKALTAHGLALSVAGVIAIFLCSQLLKIAVRMPPHAKILAWWTKIHQLILAKGPIAADIITIAILWAVTLPLTLGMAIFLGRQHWSGIDPIWSNIHSRLLGVYQPVVVLGLILISLDWVFRAMHNDIRRYEKFILVLTSLVAIVAAFGAGGAAWKHGFLLPEQLRAMDAAMETERPAELPPLSHDDRSALLYYALIKQVDTGHKALDTLFTHRPDLWQEGRPIFLKPVPGPH